MEATIAAQAQQITILQGATTTGPLPFFQSVLTESFSGNYQTSAGSGALANNEATGDYNTAVSYQAGKNTLAGWANVFLGYQAGYNETGSDTLYIANSNTSTPLIYGHFGNGTVTLNGDLTVTGTLTSSSGFTSTGTSSTVSNSTTTNSTTNTTDIATNVDLIGGNTTNITTNASGISGAMAMAQLSEADPGEKLVISVGGGTWAGSTAVAAGLSGRLNERLSLRGSASVGNGNPGISVAMGWRLK